MFWEIFKISEFKKEKIKLIYTITFNPALDYVIKMEKLEAGTINYSEEEHILAGGKGINVSIVLKELGVESTALGFIAGFTGKEIERKVNNTGVTTDFIKIENDLSRINVKISVNKEETAINTKGPFIKQNYIELLYEKIDKIKEGDTLVLSGSVPKGVLENIYESICQRLKEKNKNIRIVVDATRELLLKTLRYNPFLIKPNKEELEEILNVKISSHEDAINGARDLQKRGARNVLISMGKMGAVLLDENGKVYKREAIEVDERKSTVGAGDSMVAGFLAGYQIYNDYEKALKMGMVAATATVNSIFLATKDEINKLLKNYMN